MKDMHCEAGKLLAYFVWRTCIVELENLAYFVWRTCIVKLGNLAHFVWRTCIVKLGNLAYFVWRTCIVKLDKVQAATSPPQNVTLNTGSFEQMFDGHFCVKEI